MDFKSFLTGGAIIGVIGAVVSAAWEHIKTAFWRSISFLVSREELTEENYLPEMVMSYLILNKSFKYSRFYNKVYKCEHFPIKATGHHEAGAYEEIYGRTIVFWHGWWPMIFSSGMDEFKENKHVHKNAVLIFLRGTFNARAIIKSAVAAYNEELIKSGVEEDSKKRFFIRNIPGKSTRRNNSEASGLAWYAWPTVDLLTHNKKDIGTFQPYSSSALSHLIFPQHVIDLIKEIKFWRGREKWFREKNIPWKRGWLMYGPPGTGKTALALAFAQDLNIPIFVFHLAQLDNFELVDRWKEIQAWSPCIALIEDIDNIFHGRENVVNQMPVFFDIFNKPKKDKDKDKDDEDEDEKKRRRGGRLNFEVLLNCLDGVERNHGIFTIITTNDISKIDVALGRPRKLPDGTQEFISTRPGRIDKVIELTYMEREDKIEMARRIVGSQEPEFSEIMEFIEKYHNLEETPAQFQERCSQLILARLWKESEEKLQRELKVTI